MPKTELEKKYINTAKDTLETIMNGNADGDLNARIRASEVILDYAFRLGLLKAE